MIARDYTKARARMMREEVEGKGITDPKVLDAMGTVPRHRFLPAALESEAYGGSALPIGSGQTISAPQMVGLMTQALGLRGSERILEVGTGSGYQAAVLAHIAPHVVSVERHPDLAQKAQRLLADLSVVGVTIKVGDGTKGHAEGAPYDRIIVTAATPRVPPSLLGQLAEGGVLVVPVGNRVEQTLIRYTKSGNDFKKDILCQCVFVPLVGEEGFAESS